MIVIFSACSGKDITLLTWPYLLVCVQRLTFFSSVADLVEQVLKKQYDVSFLLHYLDDFHTLGPPNSQTCQRNLDTCIQQFQDWGIPLHPNKLEGPSTLLTVLGIELDSPLLQAHLLQEKFDCIHTLLVSWSLKRHCTQKELESLTGNLHHACKVVPSGRTFLHRMINLLSAFCRDDHPIQLNREFHLDLPWWLEFFQSWNGCSFLLSPRWAPIPDLHVSSDAAGSVGYGAISGQDWFVGRWSPLQLPLSIAYKELFSIVLAASLWGHQWSAKRVEFRSDNMAMVEVLRSGTSRNSNSMVPLRHLSPLAARHSFAFIARQVPGKSNAIASSLCVSYSNIGTSLGLGPAACSLDQKCQFYLSNGLAPSTRRLYRSHNVSSSISVR